MNNDIISRSALKEEFAKHEDRKGYLIGDWEEFIDNAPTVDTTCPNCDSGYAQGYSDGYLKGKEERPQGEWMYDYINGFGNKIGHCSKCMYRCEHYNYCPNCGAKMTKEMSNARLS